MTTGQVPEVNLDALTDALVDKVDKDFTEILAQSPQLERTIHVPRKPRPLCPVCGVRHRAGTHEKACRRNHRIKWLLRDLKRLFGKEK